MTSERRPAGGSGGSGGGVLDVIERVGNRLPDPTMLFLIGMVLVMVLSWIAVQQQWSVEQMLPRVVETADDGSAVQWEPTGRVLRAKSLFSSEGLFWAIRSMKDNFISFAPLGVVLVGMLGIGVAERSGLIASLLKGFMMLVPGVLLTPAMVFIGIMSSMAMDAGYVVLPPLAAALYKAIGRPPLAGLAAVFAGVAAGFNANLFVTGLDPMLAELSTLGARSVDADYQVAATCNWWFMIGSTIVMTLTGWGVTSFFVERRLARKSVEEGGPAPATDDDLSAQRLTRVEKRGLRVALVTIAALMVLLGVLITVPGSPLYTFEIPGPDGQPGVSAERWIPPVADAAPPAGAQLVDGQWLVPLRPPFPKWVIAIVPLIFLGFVIPGITYGAATGSIRSSKDLATMFTESMANMAPIIVLAFFAAQFIEHFRWSGLDTMLATAGGQALGQAALPTPVLLVAFVLLTAVFNLFVGSMSAKYTMFAPIFVPMFMMVGISPELTQATYRIGDSVTNIVTPLNAYLVIILVFMQKFVPKAGMGTLISTMLPYTIVFGIVWMLLLLAWYWLGIPLGPGGPLAYTGS
ncbi:MAG: AbgT family transporter [Phycisphaeraceae bacterium]|nr:AbgT family transporter [Phycisphaeraceae bacterium]